MRPTDVRIQPCSHMHRKPIVVFAVMVTGGMLTQVPWAQRPAADDEVQSSVRSVQWTPNHEDGQTHEYEPCVLRHTPPF